MQEEQAFIGRQPIMDSKQRIIGYELLFRHGADAASAVFADDLKACVQVLVGTLNDFDSEWLLGDKFAFINMNQDMLLGDMVELLPPKRTVLEVLKTVDLNEDVVARLASLKEKGFSIALDNPPNTLVDPHIMSLVDYVKVDVLTHGLDKATELFMHFKPFNVKMIAEKVETAAEHKALEKIGFKIFQGFYFAHPETLSAKVINPTFTSVLDLMNMVSRDADISEIEMGFKKDAAISFKLLRYINSVGFGLSCEIKSIGHALSILGRKQLYRWLALLMATAGENTTSPALMKTSITRGRLTELLGESYFDKAERDNLFIVGVFSLLDVILEMPMEQALDKIQLAEPVTDALLNRQGIYGPFLSLAEACEYSDSKSINALAESLQFDPEKVNGCHMAALAWVEELAI